MQPLEHAQTYHRAGLSVIPIKPNGTKAPAINWKEFQSRFPTDEELEVWWSSPGLGIAIITGEVSGFLQVIDFDAPPNKQFGELIRAELGEELVKSMPLISTPRPGGFHLYFRCPGLFQGNTVLAQKKDAEGKVITTVETRGDGGYTLTVGCPSGCHRSGNTYELKRGSLNAIPELSMEQAEKLFAICRASNEYFEPERETGPLPDPSVVGNRPGDDFNDRESWDELLPGYEWRLCYRRNGQGYWTRPGKDRREGHSATTGGGGSDLLYVFTSGGHPLKERTSYSKFAFYAAMHHGGDHSAAARDLVQQGYGDQPARPGLDFTTGAAAAPASTWPSLGKAALHGLAGEFVQLVEPHTEADPVALLAQFLVCFGNCIGSEPHFKVEADRHALNLFCCCVGETSKGRKGTSLGHVRNVCRSVDEDWDTERVQFGLSSGEGLIWAVRDPIEETKAQRQKGQPTTYEDIITDQGVSDKRLLVIEAEFAQTLRVMNRETNTLSPVIRNAWDGGNLRILTKNSPARATGAHIGIIGHISKAELLQHLTRTEMGNGFGNRFLWLCVKRSKCLPEGGNLSSVNFGPFLKELGRVVNRGKVTPEISRDHEARELWAEVYPELSSGKPGLLGAMIARSEAQAMRLACLYAALDGSMQVTIDHLRAALALWQYCEDSARYIFGDALGDPIADTILQSLKRNPAGLTRTEINQIFGGHKTTTQIDQAIILLRSQNLISSHKRSTDGRPVEYYRHAE